MKQDHLDKDMVRDAFGSESEDDQPKPKKREKGEPSDKEK